MNRHPKDENLLEYCESAVTPGAEQVRLHIETGCDRCSERTESMRGILAALRLPPLAMAPERFIQAALEGIAEKQRQHAPRTGAKALKEWARGILEEIRLGLVLDTAVGVPMQGIRGSATSGLRQMLFESPEGSLHLQVETDADSCTLIGQLVPSGPADRLAGGVVGMDGETGPLRGRLSGAGEFRIEKVPMGTIRIRIEWEDRAFVTDPIDLRAGLDG